MSNTNILGDSNKKSRFNKDLADVVNKDVESRLKKEARENKKSKKAENTSENNYTAYPIPNMTEFIMTLGLCGSGANKTQDDWVYYWNNFSKNHVMASLSNYYNIGKRSDSIKIDSFQKTLDESLYIMTSDRLSYGKDDVHDSIISHYGSKIVYPIKREIEVPLTIDDAPLDMVLSTSIGWDYLRSLFITNDAPDEMKSVLTRLSGKTASQIKFKAFGPITRNSGVNSSILLYSIKDKFVIDACNWDDITGCCYGVEYARPQVKP